MRTNWLHTNILKVLCIQNYLSNITRYLKLVDNGVHVNLSRFCIKKKVVKQHHAAAFTGGKFCTFSLKQITELRLCWDIILCVVLFCVGGERTRWRQSIQETCEQTNVTLNSLPVKSMPLSVSVPQRWSEQMEVQPQLTATPLALTPHSHYHRHWKCFRSRDIKIRCDSCLKRMQLSYVFNSILISSQCFWLK